MGLRWRLSVLFRLMRRRSTHLDSLDMAINYELDTLCHCPLILKPTYCNHDSHSIVATLSEISSYGQIANLGLKS